MHQETLLYMWHRLPINEKKKPDAINRESSAHHPRRTNQRAGRPCTLGVDRARSRSVGTMNFQRCLLKSRLLPSTAIT